MQPQLLYIVPFMLFMSSCKVVNTHTVKVLSDPVNTTDSIRFEITKGRTLLLHTASLNEQQLQILQGIQPQQCIDITTTEPFDLQHGVVRFSEYTFKKVLESETKCRKLRPQSSVRIHVSSS